MDPKPLNWEAQLQLFINRGMCVKNFEQNVKKLENISYYRLKEFARPFATTTKIKGEIVVNYNGVTFDEILKRYYQDKNFRIHLLHAIEKIEVSVKTRISYVLGKNYGAFGYLEFASWANKERKTKFDIEKVQFYIKNRLLEITKKHGNPEVKNPKNLDKDNFPSVWLGIDILMFGDIVSILNIMSEKNLREIASFYKCTNEELVSWLRCLNFIRNTCAHNSNLIDIKLKTKPKIRKYWHNYLYMIESKQGYKLTNRLAVVLVIIIELVEQINSQYKWKNIIKSISTLCISEERARLLGFNSLDSAKNIANEIKLSRKNNNYTR